jgi:hypothetical protein
MRFELKRTKVKIGTGILVVIALLLVVIFPFTSGFSGDTNLRERPVLGLFSESFQNNLKTKYPSSEWPWVRNVRIFLTWSSVELHGKGVYDWSAIDAEINAALSLGVNGILLTLSLPCPIWASNPNTPGDNPGMGPPKNLKDFGDFCRAVATRYKGYVDWYQILQEPGWDTDSQAARDRKIYFAGYSDWSYMGMLREAYQAIKEVDPESYVASGALMDAILRQADSFRTYETLLAGGNQDLSMKVESEKDIVAERPMYFNYHNAWPGGTVEQGIKEPRTTWYLAEGATHPGFEEWISIQNPGDSDANVMITYMFPGGATQQQGLTVGAHSRSTVDVNGAVGPYKDVSARVGSNQPIVVERPMYFNYHNKWTGGSICAGVPDLSDTWYLAEGATQPGFEEWISLMNPGSDPANVEITYMFPGGATQKQGVSLPPTSRETIMVNNVVGPNKDVSAMVKADKPIIAERPMYFLYHNAWSGGDTQFGATAATTSWFLSEGTTRSNKDDGYFEEWISIQNPGDADASVDLTYMFTGGSTQQGNIDVPAHSRQTILVNGVVGPDKDVSVQLNSNQPIVVERPMYFSYHGRDDGGDVELGSQGGGKTWYFAEGTTRQGFEEWLTLQNPGDTEAPTTITFMFSDGTTQQKAVTLPAKSRTTIDVNHSVGLATQCDGVALHPYDYPQWWSWYYNYLRNICAKNGVPNLEIVVTEIGWPNGDPPNFTPEGQRQAVGEVGVGGLIGAGCRKIWIFEDVDIAPGTSGGGDYYGLYNYYGSPYPAWNEYKKWQSSPTFPDYGNKPSHLPW